MSNALQVFNYEQHQIRTTVINGEVWFVGKDIAGVLGYKDTRHAIREHVDVEDKRPLSNFNEGQNTPRSNGGLGDMPIIINESGMYSLIFASKLPTARQFKR